MSEKKILKIVHCADIHIRTYRMHEEYGEAFKLFLKKVRELVKDYDREEIRIVICGDFVHQKITISNELLLLGTWFLRKLEEIAPIILIAGNHDLLENNKDRMDSLTPMVNLLSDLDITYLKESKCVQDSNIIWCPYSIFEENKRPNIEESREIFGNDKTYIGLYHAPINGLSTDLGYVFEGGTDKEYFKGCDLVMCGDIHKRGGLILEENMEDGSTKKIPIMMCSSLIQQNYGESINKHGFLFWDVDKRTFDEYDIKTSYGFYQFKIKSINDIDNESEVLTNK